MRKNPTTALTLAAVATLALGACSAPNTPEAASTPSPTSTGSPLVSYPTADLNWQELPDGGGIKYANVVGDLRGSGHYEAFVRFPKGADNPFHTHSSDLPTVVLEGTFYAIIDGKRVEYGPGSYYNLPADLQHYSGCTQEQDCVLFQYQSDHFDLNPLVEPTKK